MCISDAFDLIASDKTALISLITGASVESSRRSSVFGKSEANCSKLI